MLRKSSSIAAVAALSLAGLIGAGFDTAAVGAHTTAKPTPTKFALQATGFATRVKGGEVPVGSDRSAFQVVACTNLAGLNKHNSEATVDLGTGLSIETTKTRTWTTKSANSVSAWGRNTIAKVNLLGGPLGDLYISGVQSTSHAWHDGSGYHSEIKSSLAKLVFDGAGPIPPVNLPLPSAGQPVVIPGLAEIRLGTGVTTHNGNNAYAVADALRLHIIPTDTTVYLAHSRAIITGGVVHSMYGGSAYGSKVTALDGIVSSGRTPATLVPCVGTDGKWVAKKTVSAILAPLANAGVLTSRQRSGVIKGHAQVTTIGRVANVNLGMTDLGELKIGVVRGQANVEKVGSGYKRTIDGTTVGSITLGGNVQEFPDTGVLTIPGVATFEQNVVHKGPRSVSVVALRITLLDGRAAVINLGYAKAVLAPSGI